MLAIYKKEFRSYRYNVIGWLFLAVLLFFFGFYFCYYNIENGSQYIAYAFSNAVIVYLVIIPMITMRVFAEERKQRTEQLLFTSPVSVGRIVMAKYLSLVTILGIGAVVIALYPVVQAFSGSIPWSETILAECGFFLFGCACLAIGVFISSLFESQVIAAIVTFLILVIGIMMDSIAGMIAAPGGAVYSVLMVFSLSNPLNQFMNGILDLYSCTYYLTVIVLALFLTRQSILYRRGIVHGSLGKRGSILTSAGVIAGFAVLNLGISLLPQTYTAYDLTQERMYSISDNTRNVLDTLDEEVTVYVLANEAEADPTIQTLLSRYTDYSERIHVEFRDPQEYLNFAAQYTSEALPENSFIIMGENKVSTVAYNECYVYDMTDYNYYMSYGSFPTIGFDAEGQFTSAIHYVVSDELPVVYMVSGHDEYQVPDALLNQIYKENIELISLDLTTSAAIPENAGALMILGPMVDFTEDEIALLEEYVAEGGDVLILLSTLGENMTRFTHFLSEYGIGIQEGVVFEADTNYYYSYPYYLIADYSAAIVTEGLSDPKLPVLLAQCVGMEQLEAAAGVTVTPLLYTSDTAYSKTNTAEMESFDMEEGDIYGPFILGMQAQLSHADGTSSNLLVYGTEFLMDENVNLATSGSNYSLFVNSLKWIMGHENTVGVEAKSYTYNEVILFSQNRILIFQIVLLGVIPGLFLVAGIILFVRRRHFEGK